MTRYCFKCLLCGRTGVFASRELPNCNGGGQHEAVDCVRDYRAEAVGIGRGVKVSRDGTDRELAQLFLPDNSEFAGPGDPDGTIGMRNWHETHRPKEGAGDRSLVPGRIDRKVM